ncbi:MAG TPA: lysylphosphatidylglycerol synthase transmembrane domain-containing protein [Acidisarcina sp.]
MPTSAPPRTTPAAKKSHTKLVLWVVVTLALIALVIYARQKIQFNWSVFAQQLRQANWIKFAIGIGLIYAAYVLRATRWAVFLKPVKRVSPLSLLGSQVIGFTGVALFGRLADLVRPYLVARRVNLPIGSQIAVYTVERMFDLGSMALIFSTVLLLSPERATLPHHELLARTAFGGLLASVALAIFAGVVRFSGNGIALVAERGLGTLSPKVGASVGSKIRAFRDGLNTLSSFGDFALAFGISLLMWGLITSAYLETVHAFTASPELAGMTFARCLVLMAASLGASIVQLPVIGWFTSIGITAGTMHTIFGVAPEPALGAGAMLLVVSFMSIIPVGLIWARFEHVSLKKVAAESGEAAEHSVPQNSAAPSGDVDGTSEPATTPGPV